MYYQQRIRNVVSLLIMSMLCLASFAQGLQVQGIVKDKNGEPIFYVLSTENKERCFFAHHEHALSCIFCSGIAGTRYCKGQKR